MATQGSTRKLLGITMVIIIAYLGVAWAGFIPPEWNILHTIIPVDDTVDGTTLEDGDFTIEGIPNSVNLTFDPNQSFGIYINCTDSYVHLIKVEIDTSLMVNSTAYLDSTDGNWIINTKGDTATYTGNYLVEGVAIDTLEIIFEKDGGAVDGRCELTFEADIGSADPTSQNVIIN